MEMKKITLGTVAYTIITFTIAVLWHVVLFGQTYQALGYFDGEPNFALGFLTIFIQGAVLCFLYPKVTFGGGPGLRAAKYAVFSGLFLWTSHVLAFLAKQTTEAPWTYLAMESLYLTLQFCLFALVLRLIFARDQQRNPAAVA